MKVRSRVEFESETTGCIVKETRKSVKIIYFHASRGFISGFGKSKRFIYIEGEKGKIVTH